MFSIYLDIVKPNFNKLISFFILNRNIVYVVHFISHVENSTVLHAALQSNLIPNNPTIKMYLHETVKFKINSKNHQKFI